MGARKIGSARRAGVRLAAVCAWLVLAQPTELRAGAPLRVAPGHGIALADASREQARALGEAIAALDAGALDRAESALARARANALLGDYVAYYSAHLLQARGRSADAALAAAEARERFPESPLGSALRVLEGDALAAAGEEAAARVAWTAALDTTDDVEQRRALKLQIVRSRQRSGEIEMLADTERIAAGLFPERAVAGELPAGVRTAKMAKLAGDDLVDRGRGEEAIVAYDEALAGGLEPADRRDAAFSRGLALFRLRRYDEAVAAFAALGEQDPEARLWYARSSARAGHVKRAIAEFEHLGDTAPPEIASRALYLAGTLLEDRGEASRAMALYDRVAGFDAFPERAAEALWRAGWWSYRQGDGPAAQRRFQQMVALQEDPIDRLRPRYWAARAAAQAGQGARARAEFEAIAREHPLSYYGWRSRERLADATGIATVRTAQAEVSEPTFDARELQRVALLLEAGLAEGARDELEPLAARTRTAADRMHVGRLFTEAGDYHSAQRLVVDAYSVPLSRGLQPGRELLWWLSWPPAYEDIVARSVSNGASIERALVWAIMREESGFRPDVKSSAGAMGLMQLMPETARGTAVRAEYGDFEDDALFAPETSILLGALYLEQLHQRFPGRLSAAIGSYNAGPNAVGSWLKGDAARLDDDVWVEEIPYQQTRAYVKRVMRSFYIYRAFYP